MAGFGDPPPFFKNKSTINIRPITLYFLIMIIFIMVHQWIVFFLTMEFWGWCKVARQMMRFFIMFHYYNNIILFLGRGGEGRELLNQYWSSELRSFYFYKLYVKI